MDSIEALKNIGLTDKEARVYVALLQSGETSSYAVSMRSGLKKPTTYVILDELVEKGWAIKIPRAKKKLYTAVDPEEVFAVAEERMQIAKKVLPELKSYTKEDKKVRTLYFEGFEGIRQAMWYRMKEQENKEVVGFFAGDLDTTDEFLDLVDMWMAEMNKRHITFRGITPRHESIQRYFKQREGIDTSLIDFIFIPSEHYLPKTSIDATEDFVRIIDSNVDTPQAVIIENRKVADMVRQIFALTRNNVDASTVEDWIDTKQN